MHLTLEWNPAVIVLFDYFFAQFLPGFWKALKVIVMVSIK